ncbi:hypothetical protein PF004_g31402 [Phytophthora fragariae]|uniref:Myb/SANT-like domain-containing protein n=1 Tax=Phytophthora fragariae TaxID=53985 RepID=A0A6G0MA44_9STRA|nr:hypothetical protein PF004_g31402 [Phytophthora fragariae]
MAEGRRRNFTDEEDLALLRQALGDRPFLQPRGGILAKWDELAATLVADASFPRDNLSGKTASGRFDKLVKAHRKQSAEAATLSGVSEEESEKNGAIRRDCCTARRLCRSYCGRKGDRAAQA